MGTFKLNIVAFCVAFILGIIYVYLKTPEKKMIIKYPTPYNVDKLVYKGLSDECFKFKADEVKCSVNALEQPII